MCSKYILLNKIIVHIHKHKYKYTHIHTHIYAKQMLFFLQM